MIGLKIYILYSSLLKKFFIVQNGGCFLKMTENTTKHFPSKSTMVHSDWKNTTVSKKKKNGWESHLQEAAARRCWHIMIYWNMRKKSISFERTPQTRKWHERVQVWQRGVHRQAEGQHVQEWSVCLRTSKAAVELYQNTQNEKGLIEIVNQY